MSSAAGRGEFLERGRSVAEAGLDSRGSEFKNIHRRVSTSSFSPGGLLLGALVLYKVHHGSLLSLFVSVCVCALLAYTSGFLRVQSLSKKYINSERKIGI